MSLGDKSKTIGVVTELTLITPILPGKADELAAILKKIQLNPSAVIGDISTIHFARWVIIDDGARLLFTSNFDGTWQSYLNDFTIKIPDGLDRIWGHCVDYPGTKQFDRFCAWVDKYQVVTTCFYPAYPNFTVNDIKKALREKALLDEFLEKLG